ncbi:hypothetical protein HYW73_02370 [Candidatus Nomurabacteria bacterium]|nr:hypothetical protein [Candidatus Nomurabacteria bacterium]
MNGIAINKISNEIKALVFGAVFDVLNDPDYGLNLSAQVKKRLSAPLKGKTVSLTQIKKKYL